MALVFCTQALHAEPLLEEAQKAWADRGRPGETARAVSLWQKALDQNPGDTKLLIYLTMASGRAYRETKDKKERRHWADVARRYGEEAVAKNPNDSMAHAFDGEVLGQWADAHRGFGSLKVVKKAVEELKRSIQLDPTNFYAHMLLSQFYSQAPSFFSVGNKKEGLKEAELAVRYGPQYTISHLALARNLMETGHKNEAIAQLKKVITMPPPHDAIPEAISNKEDARQALQKLGVPVG